MGTDCGVPSTTLTGEATITITITAAGATGYFLFWNKEMCFEEQDSFSSVMWKDCLRALW